MAVGCANSDAMKCSYGQGSNYTMPTVTSVSQTSNSDLTFTGNNFFTSGYNYLAEMGAINADSVTINSATEIVATWFTGVPPKVAYPILSYGNSSDLE
jgi:hypothetical protein